MQVLGSLALTRTPVSAERKLHWSKMSLGALKITQHFCTHRFATVLYPSWLCLFCVIQYTLHKRSFFRSSFSVWPLLRRESIQFYLYITFFSTKIVTVQNVLRDTAECHLRYYSYWIVSPCAYTR